MPGRYGIGTGEGMHVHIILVTDHTYNNQRSFFLVPTLARRCVFAPSRLKSKLQLCQPKNKNFLSVLLNYLQ
jgi:hypothetical protein